MKIRLVSMRKYKMLLGWKYRLKNLITFKRTFSGKVLDVMFMCEYGISIDNRKGNFIDWMLTDKEKIRFNIGMNLRKRKN
tara:strand:+ start:79 stop:318 length:240 start_codon:yes stop_codon:yes gene_type:complete